MFPGQKWRFGGRKALLHLSGKAGNVCETKKSEAGQKGTRNEAEKINTVTATTNTNNAKKKLTRGNHVWTRIKHQTWGSRTNPLERIPEEIFEWGSWTNLAINLNDQPINCLSARIPHKCEGGKIIQCFYVSCLQHAFYEFSKIFAKIIA